MMTNKEMMKKMVKEFGFDAVAKMVEAAQREIKQDEEKYKYIISPYEYGVGRNRTKEGSVSFPEWVNDILHEIGYEIWEKGSGESRDMKITHENFAKYIIYTCNDDGKMLRDVLDILTSAPAWCKGRGMTRARMELVFHILVLHREKRDDVIREMKKLINKYDPVTLKVFANADNDYRHTLNYDCKMIAFAEKQICKAIGDIRLFKAA